MNLKALVGKASGLIISSIIPLLLLTWLPMASIATNEEVSLNIHGAVTVGVQGTPTPMDPTVTALEKEKLLQEVNQLKNQNSLAWTNILIPFSTPFSILVALVAAFIGLVRWLGTAKPKGKNETKNASNRSSKA